jgi:hypothetical protein
VRREVSARGGGLCYFLRSLRAGWQPRSILLPAVARGQAHKVCKPQPGAGEERTPGTRQHTHRGEQVRRAQGGLAVVEEDRRRGRLVDVDVGLRKVMLGRNKPGKEPSRVK